MVQAADVNLNAYLKEKKILLKSKEVSFMKNVADWDHPDIMAMMRKLPSEDELGKLDTF